MIQQTQYPFARKNNFTLGFILVGLTLVFFLATDKMNKVPKTKNTKPIV